jgi:hypothetical protein
MRVEQGLVVLVCVAVAGCAAPRQVARAPAARPAASQVQLPRTAAKPTLPPRAAQPAASVPLEGFRPMRGQQAAP